MTFAQFTPHWRATGSADVQGPFSWVFFAVARVAGRHRPVAVVSSVGDNEGSESLMGGPLAAACQRIITIFSDRANAPAVRAELALADGFYMRTRDDGRGRDEYRPDRVHLPELDRRALQRDLRYPPWDHGTVPEFPFIAACLLHGVGFDARTGMTRPARPQPLGTVYRDTSLEWGMVVIDITELEAIRYGIVGFTVTSAVFVESEADARRRAAFRVLGPGAFEPGELRVMDEVRPRRAMSAAEYLAKWPHDFLDDNLAVERLSSVPLVDADAMALVWPPGPDLDDGVLRSLAGLSTANDASSEDQAGTQQLIQSALDLHGFDTSVLNDVPGFQELLKSRLILHSARLGNTPSTGKLIRLAFTSGDHLGLELLSAVSIGAISAALGVYGTGHITSLSVRIDSISATPAQIAEALAGFDTLRSLYLLQTPGRGSEALSAQLFEELTAWPQVLRRAKVMLAGAYSAALRKRFWLPAVPTAAPLDVFPVQQVLARCPAYYPHGGDIRFVHSCVYLGDTLLGPERLASGLLIYFRSLIASDTASGDGDGKQGLFSFSSCPASLADEALDAAEISPIPAENYALPMRTDSPHQIWESWARMRDLAPGGWTVLVWVEKHRNLEVEKHRDLEVERRGAEAWRPCRAHCIRYAFVRSRRGRIAVDDDGPPVLLATLPELEVVGLQEFLAATAPEVDPTIIDRRLRGFVDEMDTWSSEAPPPPGVERLSVLTQEEAAGMLLGCMEEARRVNGWLRRSMMEAEDPESEFCTLPTRAIIPKLSGKKVSLIVEPRSELVPGSPCERVRYLSRQAIRWRWRYLPCSRPFSGRGSGGVASQG